MGLQIIDLQRDQIETEVTDRTGRMNRVYRIAAAAACDADAALGKRPT